MLPTLPLLLLQLCSCCCCCGPAASTAASVTEIDAGVQVIHCSPLCLWAVVVVHSLPTVWLHRLQTFHLTSCKTCFCNPSCPLDVIPVSVSKACLLVVLCHVDNICPSTEETLVQLTPAISSLDARSPVIKAASQSHTECCRV